MFLAFQNCKIEQKIGLNMIKLTGNEHLLDAVFEYCEDIITVKDLNQRYVAYNKAFLKHIGIEDGNAVLGKTVQEIVPKSACDVIEENVRKVITELKPCTYTFVLNKDGCSKYVKQTATPVIRNGVLTNILMVSSDITNEECLNEKLIEKNYQLNTLLEYLPFFVYMKDKNRKLVVATEKSRNFVENGVDNLSADIRLDIPTATEQVANEDNYVLQNKKYLSKEKTAIDINGKTHWYRIHKAPILTENNDINGLVTIAKNIDKEKQLETQKNLFLATLSHDLKNPMQAQISSLNMLYRQLVGKMNDDQKEIFELIIESSIYMKTMLCTLLKTCKESDGAIQLERKNFDMKKIINRAVKEIKELAACKKITLSVSSISDENFVFADENQMRRVVSNLLNNAVNYAFENTEIKISLLSKGEKFFLKIQNRSDIISDSLKKHIFDKYVCSDNLQNNSQTGLGLYFCRKIIEAHEGHIRLYNNEYENIFEVELPLTNENSVLISQVVL